MRKLENGHIIDLSNLSTKLGLLAGSAMAIVLFVFQMVSFSVNPRWQLINYLFLALIIGLALKDFNPLYSGQSRE